MFFSLYLYLDNGVIDDLTVVNDTGKPEDDIWNTSVAPLSKETRETNFEEGCMDTTGKRWHGCFGKILNDNWEMTY